MVSAKSQAALSPADGQRSDSSAAAEPSAAIERFLNEVMRWGSRDQVRRSMASAGSPLSPTDRWLLGRIGEVGPVRLSDLAAWQEVDRSTITTQVHRLEDRGLVDRSTDPADRRSSLVRLTAKGRRAQAANRAQSRRFLDRLTDGWDERDRRDLDRLLSRITESLEATRGTP